jgi:integrase
VSINYWAEGITSIAKTNGEEHRLPYSPGDLKKLFSRDACESRKVTPANYWLPWLALYTGARLEELGQLRTADIRREDGVHRLTIEPGDGKQIKTKSSRRRVPLHPELVKLGFVAFVERQKAAGEVRLFPELRPTRYGSLTAAWSKYWGRHARCLGVTDPRTVFHSFRHGWKDAARAVMPEEHHDVITGHSNGSVGRRYGTGVPLKVLAQSMAKVRFAGLKR